MKDKQIKFYKEVNKGLLLILTIVKLFGKEESKNG